MCWVRYRENRGEKISPWWDSNPQAPNYKVCGLPMCYNRGPAHNSLNVFNNVENNIFIKLEEKRQTALWLFLNFVGFEMSCSIFQVKPFNFYSPLTLNFFPGLRRVGKKEKGKIARQRFKLVSTPKKNICRESNNLVLSSGSHRTAFVKSIA